MTRLDPLLAAGVQCCLICSADGFPVSAVWLDDDLILVTYGAPCEHGRESTQLIVPSQITADGNRCAGTTAAGAPCRSWPRRGAFYCAAHDRQDARDAPRS